MARTTLQPLISTRRLECSRKSAPRRGTHTGASWKFQVYTLEPEPQEKQRGMMRVPLHYIGEQSAVSRRTSLTDEDLGPGNTNTEAPELTRNSWLDRIFLRKMREELQNSTGAEAIGGESAGWTGVSTCRTASFPTWNMVSCSLEASHHVFYETSRLEEALENRMMELGLEKTWREGSSRREDSSEA